MGSFRTLRTFGQPIEAQVARGKLESEGVECFIADENTISANPLYSAAVGGVKLQVREEELERAREILGIEPPAPPAAVADHRTCPSCGMVRIRPWQKTAVGRILRIFGLGGTTHCPRCGSPF